jgi:hypothetical protein
MLQGNDRRLRAALPREGVLLAEGTQACSGPSRGLLPARGRSIALHPKPCAAACEGAGRRQAVPTTRTWRPACSPSAAVVIPQLGIAATPGDRCAAVSRGQDDRVRTLRQRSKGAGLPRGSRLRSSCRPRAQCVDWRSWMNATARCLALTDLHRVLRLECAGCGLDKPVATLLHCDYDAFYARAREAALATGVAADLDWRGERERTESTGGAAGGAGAVAVEDATSALRRLRV